MITVAHPELRELQQVYSIEVKSFENPYPYWYIKTLYALAGELFLVARSGETVVGYVIALFRRRRVCHLVSIAVAPECRRNRIGSALLASIEQLCLEAGAKAMMLEVDAYNIPALAMYRAHGYQPAMIVPGYYGRNRPALVMVKPLEA